MVYQTPQLRTFVISLIMGVKRTSKGNIFLECMTTSGETIAFWGSASNMTNINKIQQQQPPFQVTCGCIKSNFQNHDVWVPESATVT